MKGFGDEGFRTRVRIQFRAPLRVRLGLSGFLYGFCQGLGLKNFWI